MTKNFGGLLKLFLLTFKLQSFSFPIDQSTNGLLRFFLLLGVSEPQLSRYSSQVKPMINAVNILLRHNFIEIPSGTDECSSQDLATVLSNLSYYGYALSVDAYKAVCRLSHEELAAWWATINKQLSFITGDSRKMDRFVVYKNFPEEVLNKSEAEYWIPQLLMYWGFPNDMFTQPENVRPEMNENRKAIVLSRARPGTLNEIFVSYLAAPARWKSHEKADALYLAAHLPLPTEKIAFKENLILLATHFIDSGTPLRISAATDVLRLAVGLSNGDISLAENSKFKSFRRPVRRYLCILLENASNLSDDIARRPEMFKRFLHHIHPGDFLKACPGLCAVMDKLYFNKVESFNAKVEKMIVDKNPELLKLLASRPGEFRRRLRHMLELFGEQAVKAFSDPKVLAKLTTAQVVSLRTYLETVNGRYFRVFPPKGNWNKLQIGEAKWAEDDHLLALIEVLGDVLKSRLPKVKHLDPKAALIKLPTNGDAGEYTRGTVFPIPPEMTFIRSASYWKISSKQYVWFDNGWNFFDHEWKNMGAVGWSSPSFGGTMQKKGRSWNVHYENPSAVFSGDPTNTKEMQGRACQMIDLYLDRLKAEGVRFAVWNILAYSKIPFSDAEDVFAALQWGEKPADGKLFEPSRCQVAFPLTSKQMTKYIVMIDVERREMTYLDANLAGSVAMASANGERLEKTMPAMVEYLRSLPSVYDLFVESVDPEKGELSILYSDKDVKLDGGKAFVFRPENKDNDNYTRVPLNKLLG